MITDEELDEIEHLEKRLPAAPWSYGTKKEKTLPIAGMSQRDLEYIGVLDANGALLWGADEYAYWASDLKLFEDFHAEKNVVDMRNAFPRLIAEIRRLRSL